MCFISFLQYVCVLSCFGHVQLFVTLRTVDLQTPLSRGFSRQEYWSGLPCLPPGDLPDPEVEPASLVSCIGRWILYHQYHLGSPFFSMFYPNQWNPVEPILAKVTWLFCFCLFSLFKLGSSQVRITHCIWLLSLSYLLFHIENLKHKETRMKDCI